MALESIPIPGADPDVDFAASGVLFATRVLAGEGAGRFFCGWAATRRPSFSLSGNLSKRLYSTRSASNTKLGERAHTFKAVEHLSAAWLLIARPLSAAFPSLTSARISSDPGLSRFSSTK